PNNYCSIRATTSLPWIALQTVATFFFRKSAPKQMPIYGSCRFLEIESNSLICKASLTNRKVYFHRTENGSPTLQTRQEDRKSMFKVFRWQKGQNDRYPRQAERNPCGIVIKSNYIILLQTQSS